MYCAALQGKFSRPLLGPHGYTLGHHPLSGGAPIFRSRPHKDCAAFLCTNHLGVHRPPGQELLLSTPSRHRHSPAPVTTTVPWACLYKLQSSSVLSGCRVQEEMASPFPKALPKSPSYPVPQWCSSSRHCALESLPGA